MQQNKPAFRLGRGTLIKLAVLGIVALGGGLMLLKGVDVRGAIDQMLEIVREAGPLAFFGAMAILPALGCPMAPFTLSAGPVFGPVMGIGWVIAAAFAAMLGNILLGYSLARWVMHPPLERLVLRLGYKLPRIPAEQYWDWTILLRVTPGPPFFVQNILLGLARVPMRIYVTVSVLVAWSYTAGFVIFGDALIHGEGRKAVFGVVFLVVVICGVQLVRKHFARKKAAAAAAVAAATE